jgi:hypothetical protein
MMELLEMLAGHLGRFSQLADGHRVKTVAYPRGEKPPELVHGYRLPIGLRIVAAGVGRAPS